jgi:hypothetical protein
MKIAERFSNSEHGRNLPLIRDNQLGDAMSRPCRVCGLVFTPPRFPISADQEMAYSATIVHSLGRELPEDDRDALMSTLHQVANELSQVAHQVGKDLKVTSPASLYTLPLPFLMP